MPVYKNEENNTWYVRFKTKDSFGKTKEIWKRGFKTKKDATEWESEQKLINQGSTGMTFKSFCEEVFLPDVKLRRKTSTYTNYAGVINRDLIPFYGKMRLEEITPNMIRTFQNRELVKNSKYNKPKSEIYLKNEHRLLSSIFNFAVRYYGLKTNPAKIAGNYRTTIHKEMNFWTLSDYKKFEKAIEKEDPVMSLIICLAYFSGARRGELLAWNENDFDFVKNTVTVSKTKYRLKGGKYLLTTPKTAQSYRTIPLPEFLVDKVKQYITDHPEIKKGQLLFPYSEHYIRNAIQKYSKVAGIQAIRIHDLRHSYISLLIHSGYTVAAVSKLSGHSSSEILLRYSHMFPNDPSDVARKLEELNAESEG